MFLSYEDSAEFELYHLLYIENPEEDRAGKPIFPRSKGWSKELGRAREGLVYFPCSSPSQSSTACAVATAQVTGLLRLSRAWPELPGCGARSRFSVRELMPLFFFFSFLSFGFVSLNKNLLFLLQPLLSPTPPSPWQHILFPRNWF